MSIRVFKYVLCVAQYLHFRRAAEHCDVSQSTLSTQIRRLEDYLGVEIFIRHGRSVSITERGLEIIELAEIVIDAANKMRQVSAK